MFCGQQGARCPPAPRAENSVGSRELCLPPLLCASAEVSPSLLCPPPAAPLGNREPGCLRRTSGTCIEMRCPISASFLLIRPGKRLRPLPNSSSQGKYGKNGTPRTICKSDSSAVRGMYLGAGGRDVPGRNVRGWGRQSPSKRRSGARHAPTEAARRRGSARHRCPLGPAALRSQRDAPRGPSRRAGLSMRRSPAALRRFPP